MVDKEEYMPIKDEIFEIASFLITFFIMLIISPYLFIYCYIEDFVNYIKKLKNKRILNKDRIDNNIFKGLNLRFFSFLNMDKKLMGKYTKKEYKREKKKIDRLIKDMGKPIYSDTDSIIFKKKE